MISRFLFLAGLGILMACSGGSDNQSVEAEGPAQWLNFPGPGKKIVMISGDEEYRSEEALPQLAAILSSGHGFDCTVLFSQDPSVAGVVDPNYLGNIPGLEALADADLMIIFTRFRALPDEQMKFIDDYLSKGKPVIGIRTATHAFNFKDSTSAYFHYGNYYNKEDEWQGGFGRVVLGEKWISHHGRHKHESTRGWLAEESMEHPILNGIQDGDIWGSTDVYGVRLPLPASRVLVKGQVVSRAGEYDEADLFFGMRETDAEPGPVRGDNNMDPNDPMMPIAWLHEYKIPGGKEGTAFASTIGASSDLLDEEVRRMYVNAAYYLTGIEVLEKADVDLVGDYQPSQYSFQTDEYWTEKNMIIDELAKNYSEYTGINE